MERSEKGSDPAAAADVGPLGAPAQAPGGAPAQGRWAPPSPQTPTPPPPPGWVPPAPPSRPDGDPPWDSDRDTGPLNRQLAAGGAPASRHAAWTWLLFAALGFLAGQILAVVAISVAAGVSGNLHDLNAITQLSEPPTWYIVSTLLGLWAGFFGAAWLSSWAQGTRSLVRDLGLRFRWIDVLGIPIGVGGQFLVALIYVPIASHVHNFNQRFSAPSQRLVGGSHGVDYVIIAIFTVVGAPFFEELFFRGVLLRALARLFGNFLGWVGPALAMIVTGVLFGLAHAESLQLLGLAVFGVILSFVSYRTGRLGMNMVAHASFNLMALAAVVVPLAAGPRLLF